jgi:hypothetical protein
MKRQLIYHTPVELSSTAITANDASLVSGQGVHEHARIKCISRDSLSLNCNQETLHRLLPNTASVSPKQPVKLEVSFKLESFLQVAANVVCVRRLSKDTFQLDLCFEQLDSKSESEIDKYVEQSLYGSTHQTNQTDKSEELKKTGKLSNFSAVA